MVVVKKLIAAFVLASLLITTGIACSGGTTTKATTAADKDKDKDKK